MPSQTTFSQLRSWIRPRREVLTPPSPNTQRCLKLVSASLILLLGSLTGSFAQTLSRAVFASAGGFGTSTAGQLSSTIGQIFPQTTEITGNTFLSQGFQQPEDLGMVSIQPGPPFAFRLYPNPSTGRVFLDGLSEAVSQYEIFNNLGQILQRGNLVENTITHPGLPSGVYYLRLYARDRILWGSAKLMVK